MGTQVIRNFEKPIYTLNEHDYKLKIDYTLGDGCYSYFENDCLLFIRYVGLYNNSNKGDEIKSSFKYVC